MEHVAIEAVDDAANPLAEHEVRKPVSRALGTDHLAMNYFDLSPGESFSGGLHAHHDQEEVFYVVSGTARFEVGRDRESVTVGPDEVVRFAPGEFQTGGVPAAADEGVVAIALGAPGASHDWDALDSVVYCRECEAEHVHETRPVEDGQFRFTCTGCGYEFAL